MQPVIETVKSNTLKFSDDLTKKLEVKGKVADQIRIRVVAFGDCNADANPLNASPFFTVLPAMQTAELNSFVTGLRANGGGDEPESGLEALAIAMASDWIQEGDRQRHIIVMFTDASAHRLEDRVGDLPGTFASQVPSSIDKMTDGWEGGGQSASGVATTLKQPARRLVLFAPDMYPWPTIGDSWAQTVFLPSKAGEGLAEMEYDTILEVLANTV
jgi:hypothetical protein